MAKEVKPIKTKRIDNSDGTYTVKEVYDKPNFDCYLSDIETFDTNDRMLNGTYYNDKKFKERIFSETREYLDNGNYYKIEVYEKLQYDSYIVAKCLCDSNDKKLEAWFYKDKECSTLHIYNTFEYLDNNIQKARSYNYNDSYYYDIYSDDKQRTIKEVYYTDNDFNTISSTLVYSYDDIGNYTVNATYTSDDNDVNKCHSSISYINSDNQLLKAESFYNEDFTKFYSLNVYNYNKDGSYTVKNTYDNCDENGWKSSIEKYDKNHNLIHGEYYQDNDYKTLGQTTIRKTYKNGSYKDIKIRTIPDENGWFVMKELYDRNYNFISGIYETLPKDDNQIILKVKWKYNDDGTHDRYCSYIKQEKGKGYLSYIEKDSSNDEYISSKFFKDRHFKKLYYSCNKETLSENHYIDKIIEDNVFNGEQYKSCTFESITDEQIEKERYYKNKDYTDLIASTYKHINNNGNSEKQIIYENDQGGWYSTIFERDNQSNITRQVWYIDKDMQQPYCEQVLVEYKDNDNYAYKTIYYDNTDPKEYYTITKQFYIEYYSNNKVYKTLYYKDKEFSQLQATETYEHLPKGKSVARAVFEEPYKNMQSIVEYKNKDNKSFYCLGYTDRNFETLFRRTWVKYTKKYGIRLRIYANMQDGFNTEIEKYDKGRKLIYCKQYKVNYIIARLLFLFAK